MMEANSKLFIYTDGGARPNPGPSGYGIHMCIGKYDGISKQILGKYILTDKGYMLKTKHKSSRESIPLLEFTHGIDIYGYIKNSNTNNKAELDAVITACNNIDKVLKEINNNDIKDILFLIDSTYVINFMNKILDKTINIKNINLNTEYITNLKYKLETLKNRFKITVKKVPAHSDDLGNNQADMLATMGININNNLENTLKMKIIEKDYWKDPNVNTDLFYFSQLFNFYPENGYDSGIYYGLNYKPKDDLGKMMSPVSYTILNLKDNNEIVGSILKIIREKLKNDFFPYTIFISELINKKLLRDYLRFGRDFLKITNGSYPVIQTVTGVEIAVVLKSPGLSNRIMDKFLFLNTDVKDFINKTPVKKMEYIDITNLIYETNKKNKLIILPDFINDKYVIKYKHNKNLLRIRSKLDLPNRNILKRLEKNNPKVFLIIRDYDTVYEYNTMVVLEDESHIFTSNIYSNKVIQKK